MVAPLWALPVPGVIMGVHWYSGSHCRDGVPVVFVVPFVLVTSGSIGGCLADSEIVKSTISSTKCSITELSRWHVLPNASKSDCLFLIWLMNSTILLRWSLLTGHSCGSMAKKCFSASPIAKVFQRWRHECYNLLSIYSLCFKVDLAMLPVWQDHFWGTLNCWVKEISTPSNFPGPLQSTSLETHTSHLSQNWVPVENSSDLPSTSSKYKAVFPRQPLEETY